VSKYFSQKLLKSASLSSSYDLIGNIGDVFLGLLFISTHFI